MGDDESGITKDSRIKYLAAGAIGGGILGLLANNPFLGSSLGILAAVLWWTTTSEQKTS
jgi:hypothetical protein